jgi:hypothetical protein
MSDTDSSPEFPTGIPREGDLGFLNDGEGWLAGIISVVRQDMDLEFIVGDVVHIIPYPSYGTFGFCGQQENVSPEIGKWIGKRVPVKTRYELRDWLLKNYVT